MIQSGAGERWQWRGTLHSPKAPALQELHHQMVLRHIQDTRWGNLTHLQRCSWCILQLQPTGPVCACMLCVHIWIYMYSISLYIYIWMYMSLCVHIWVYIYEDHWITFQTFFVWALLLIVHTWNSSHLRSNLLRLQCTFCTVPITCGRPHGSLLVWVGQWPSSQPLSSSQLSHNEIPMM